MASSSSASPLLLLPPPLAALLLLAMAMAMAMAAEAQAPSPSPSPAPAPSPAPPAFANITQILHNAGDFSNLIALLNATGVGTLFQQRANESEVGISIFAPTDAAFGKQPAAALIQGASAAAAVSLLEFHALNAWKSLSQLQNSADNVSSTFASFNAPVGGKYTLNITFLQGVVRLITPWNNVPVTNTLYNSRPVSIFAIEQVLLPVDLFGLPSPAPAPSPASSSSSAPSSSSSSSSSSSGLSSSSSSSSASGPSPSSPSPPLPSPLSLPAALAFLLASSSIALSFLSL